MQESQNTKVVQDAYADILAGAFVQLLHQCEDSALSKQGVRDPVAQPCDA